MHTRKLYDVDDARKMYEMPIIYSKCAESQLQHNYHECSPGSLEYADLCMGHFEWVEIGNVVWQLYNENKCIK